MWIVEQRDSYFSSTLLLEMVESMTKYIYGLGEQQHIYHGKFVVVQLLSRVWRFAIPWNSVHQVRLSFTISQNLFKLMSIELAMPSNHLILCCPLLPLPSIFPSFMVFSKESALHIRWPKYWGFSFTSSTSSGYSGLTFFRIDRFGLLAVSGTLESSPTPESESINSSVLNFMVQLSHLYMTTGKTIAFTIGTFAGKVMTYQFSVQFSSVAQSCPTLCDPMNHRTLGPPVHHQLLEFTQTHVHRVSDSIQPSHPLLSPSPPPPNPSQDQGLFQWVNSSHEVAKVLEFFTPIQISKWKLVLLSTETCTEIFTLASSIMTKNINSIKVLKNVHLKK